MKVTQVKPQANEFLPSVLFKGPKVKALSIFKAPLLFPIKYILKNYNSHVCSKCINLDSETQKRSLSNGDF